MTYSVEFDTPAVPSELHVALTDPESPNYRERLKRWEIVRIQPNLPPVVVARFRSRSDADGHLDWLQQQIPDGQFIVNFNPQKET